MKDFDLGFIFSHRYFRRQKHEVAIIMGSNSDWPILEPAEKTLKEFGVEVEVIVASAHRTPDVVHEFAAGARNRGVEVLLPLPVLLPI